MSVCYIGLLQNDRIKYIGCMHDGDLLLTGTMLQAGYTSVEKIQALLNLGYISQLGYNLDAPKKFKDETEARRCYAYSWYIRTTFVIAYIRDLCDVATANIMRECSVGEYWDKPDYKYFYDPKQKSWFVYVDDSKAYDLKKLLTDENYFTEFKGNLVCKDQWSCVSKKYAKLVKELSEKGANIVISKYNAWLNQNRSLNCRNLEFGYAIRDGKRFFALLKKNDNKNGRRQVVEYSACIGDLVEYLINTHEVWC